MTWIKQIPYDEADDELKRVYESVRALYPVEYAGPPLPSLVYHGERPEKAELQSLGSGHNPASIRPRVSSATTAPSPGCATAAAARAPGRTGTPSRTSRCRPARARAPV